MAASKPRARSVRAESRPEHAGLPDLHSLSSQTGDESRTNERDAELFRLLEQLLNLTRKSSDSAAIVQSLREHFCAPISLLSANRHLLESCGLQPRDAMLLSQIPVLARYCLADAYPAHPKLNHMRLAAKFLHAHAFCLTVERFHLLCLDRQGRMQALVFLHEGIEDGALFSVRRLMTEVMRLRPHAVVLSHNHPGGTLTPSQEDFNCTLAAMRTLTAIGVPVLDHLITTRSAAVSMRANGYIPEVQWLQQSSESPLLRSWLSGEEGGDPIVRDL